MLELIGSAIAVYNGVKGTKDRQELMSKMLVLEQQHNEMFNMFVNEIQALQDRPFHIGLTYFKERMLKKAS